MKHNKIGIIIIMPQLVYFIKVGVIRKKNLEVNKQKNKWNTKKGNPVLFYGQNASFLKPITNQV
jgi:hypothetical protein